MRLPRMISSLSPRRGRHNPRVKCPKTLSTRWQRRVSPPPRRLWEFQAPFPQRFTPAASIRQGSLYRISPDPGLIDASPLLADGKLYYVSQHNGTYVLAAEPKFKLLAPNTFEDDSTRANPRSRRSTANGYCGRTRRCAASQIADRPQTSAYDGVSYRLIWHPLTRPAESPRWTTDSEGYIPGVSAGEGRRCGGHERCAPFPHSFSGTAGPIDDG
jgi:hypothetical protein